MTEQEFKDWKASPITKQVFTAIGNRIHDLRVALGETAGLDMRADATKVGGILAFQDILTMEFEETHTQ